MNLRFFIPGIEPALKKSLKISIIIHIVLISILILSPGGGARKKHISGVYRVRISSLPVSQLAPQPSTTVKVQRKQVVEEIGKTGKEVVLPAPKGPGAKPSGKEIKAEKKVTTARKTEGPQRKEKKGGKTEQEDILAMLMNARKELSKAGPPSGKADGRNETAQGDIMTGALLSGRAKEYYDAVEQKIKNEWILPGSLAMEAKKLRTIIGITVKRDGTIQDAWIEQSSGNIYYDRAALRAVKKANPLPPLPQELPDKTLEIGIIF